MSKYKFLLMFLTALAMLALISPAKADFNYIINATHLPFNTTENITIFANESANISVYTDDDWIFPSVSTYQMNGSSNFTLTVNISVPANALAGNRSQRLDWTAFWDNTSSTNHTLFTFTILNDTIPPAPTVLPNLQFTIKDSKDSTKLVNANINMSSTSYTGFGVTDENGHYTFNNLSLGCYNYNIVRLHYYSNTGQVCLDNTTLGTIATKIVLLDIIETEIAKSLIDQVGLLQNTTTNLTLNAMKTQLESLQQSNAEKDNAINVLNNFSNTCLQNKNVVETDNSALVKQILGLKNKSLLAVIGTAIGSIFGTLGGLYIKTHGIIWGFF